MVNLSECEGAEDGGIAIDALPAAARELVRVEPGIKCA
jgi:hypothetical protein